jgi:hypothetical protein
MGLLVEPDVIAELWPVFLFYQVDRDVRDAQDLPSMVAEVDNIRQQGIDDRWFGAKDIQSVLSIDIYGQSG